jgi:hypothetical protein
MLMNDADTISIPPPYMASRPLLLVLAIQVQELIDEINDEFNCALTLPTDLHLGLVLPFDDDGTPQPKFLGQCTSREMKEKLEYSIRTASHDQDDHNPRAGFTPEVDRSFAAFRRKSKLLWKLRRIKPRQPRLRSGRTRSRNARNGPVL